jgi:hypothetical protein
MKSLIAAACSSLIMLIAFYPLIADVTRMLHYERNPGQTQCTGLGITKTSLSKAAAHGTMASADVVAEV